MGLKILAIILFLAMYVLMTLFMRIRVWIVLSTAVLFLVTGILPVSVLPEAINWNVLLMISGTMILVDFFIESKMPNLIADFLDFFWMNGRPGMFFAVELGALATVPVMMILFHSFRQPVEAKGRTKVTDYKPSWLLILMVVLLICASFIPNKPEVTNGVICCCLALAAVVLDYLQGRSTKNTVHAFRNLDYETLGLLFCLFLVIQGITEVGIVDDAAQLIAKAGGKNMFLLYTIIVWGSVLFSAFIDNIPYVATMLPVITGITRALGVEPYLLYFGLLTGATLGGNLTPIGASANITATGLLKKEGFSVSFGDFMKIGVPFTLTAVFVGYLFIWIFWA